MVTKINYKEPEIFEIEEIRADVRKNIDKYSLIEINKKISQINSILQELKNRKYDVSNKFRTKNLLIIKNDKKR